MTTPSTASRSHAPSTADLARRVTLVTGSSRGIGAAIARELARHGAAVAVHGRDPAARASVAADINRSGGVATAVTGDVTSDFDPLRRLGVPGDVASAAFLASDRASWITGAVLAMTGGALLR